MEVRENGIERTEWKHDDNDDGKRTFFSIFVSLAERNIIVS